MCVISPNQGRQVHILSTTVFTVIILNKYNLERNLTQIWMQKYRFWFSVIEITHSGDGAALGEICPLCVLFRKHGIYFSPQTFLVIAGNTH